MRRALTIILITAVAMWPLEISTAHGIRQSVSSNEGRHYKRHSKAWWRRYRARLRRKREAALAAHRNALLGPALPPVAGLTDPLLVQPTRAASTTTVNNADMRVRADKPVSSVPGQVSLTVVAHSRPTPAYLTAREQSRLLSGVSVADLRRVVIDKMLTSGGWVTNDYVRDVNGQKVFVVTAQTPADGRSPQKTWSFYFTEVNGRVYNLTTSTTAEFSDRMALEAERFIDSLRTLGALLPSR